MKLKYIIGFLTSSLVILIIYYEKNNDNFSIHKDLQGIEVNIYYKNNIYKNIIHNNYIKQFENNFKKWMANKKVISMKSHNNVINIYVNKGTPNAYEIPWPKNITVTPNIIINSKNKQFIREKSIN